VKAITALAVWAVFIACKAQANSISLEFTGFVEGDQARFVVNYDFSEFAMFGGGIDLVYDTTVLEFVSFTQNELPFDAQAPASPFGQLEFPGLYAGFGIGTFDFINGMNSVGTIGTFIFNVSGGLVSDTFTACGPGNADPFIFTINTICVTPNEINPMVSLAGDVVNDQLFTNVPLPASLWFLLSAVGAMAGLRKSRSS